MEYKDTKKRQITHFGGAFPPHFPPFGWVYFSRVYANFVRMKTTKTKYNMKLHYAAPETELVKITLEVNFADSTPIPNVGIEDGLPFDDFNPQIW
jgi:hypothetical protein